MHQLVIFRDQVLGQELNLLIINLKPILLQINIRLMPLQHIQSQQHIRPIAFKNCQGTGKMLGADFDHDGVDSAGDFSLADAFCDAAETGVDESGDTAPLRALLHH